MSPAEKKIEKGIDLNSKKINPPVHVTVNKLITSQTDDFEE
jgi:hypothetical protein